jgi:hypothetical protein
VDISPVSAVRPLTLIRPSPGAPDLTRVTETENRGRSGEDEYTPAEGEAKRGLEDEEDEAAAGARDEQAEGRSGGVSVFA